MAAASLALAISCTSTAGETTRRDTPAGGGTTLLLAGDVMLGRGIDQILPHSVDPVLYEGYVLSAKTYVAIAEEKSGPIPRKVPPGYVWGDALAVLERHRPTARIVNLETSVTTAAQPWPGKGIHYRMHPKNVGVLTAAGIDCAVLANNHVLDWGRAGLLETVETLRAAGVTIAGAGRDMAAAAQPAVIPVPDGRVLVFGMAHETSGVPPEWAAGPGTPGVRLLPDLSMRTARRMAEEIRSHPRDSGDRVVVSIHWGGNWGYAVPPEQERFARVLIDEGGVDVVHGHSSHHPKRIAVHGGRLVLYGAGDLINDYEGIGGHEELRPGLALLYLPTLDRSGRLESMLLAPMRLHFFRLEQASAEEARWLRDRLARESPGVSLETRGDGLIVLRPS